MDPLFLLPGSGTKPLNSACDPGPILAQQRNLYSQINFVFDTIYVGTESFKP